MSLTSPVFFTFLAGVVIAFNIYDSIAVPQVCTRPRECRSSLQAISPMSPRCCPCLDFCRWAISFVSVLYFQKSPVVLAIGIAAVLGCYVFLKRFSFFDDLGHLPFPYLTMGLSYILFRILHVMVDVQSGDLAERVGPLAFLRFTCNFLCFVSGPIQRYQDFHSADGTAIWSSSTQPGFMTPFPESPPATSNS